MCQKQTIPGSSRIPKTQATEDRRPFLIYFLLCTSDCFRSFYALAFSSAGVKIMGGLIDSINIVNPVYIAREKTLKQLSLSLSIEAPGRF